MNFDAGAQDNDVKVIDVETNTTLVTDAGTENNFSATGDNGFSSFNSGHFGIGTTTPGSILTLQSVANFRSGTSTIFSGLQVADLRATSTIQTAGLTITGSITMGGDTVTDFIGDGLELSSGSIIFDCSDVAGTGLTCSGEDLPLPI